MITTVAAGLAFICTPIAVWDGDGPIWCREGPRVRIADISARELDGSCRRGHPCPEASGLAARDALVDILGGAKGQKRDGHLIVRGSAMRCVSLGASFHRTVARCRLADGRDLGGALIATGKVIAWMR